VAVTSGDGVVYSSSIPNPEILFATDFSEPARRALACAKQIARRRGAFLRVLHVIDLTSHTVPAHNSFNAAIESARRWLRTNRRQLRLAGIQEAATIISGGSISLAVRDAAIRYHATLLVMGLHGDPRIATPSFGGNVRRLFRSSPCPMLTAGVRGPNNPAPTFERVLFVTDPSPEGVAAARQAWPLDGQPEPIAHFVVLPSDATAQLVHGIDAAPALAPRSIVAQQQAAGVILAKAADAKADLIVIGLRRGSCLDTLSLGSVIRSIWSKVACPVLTARAGDEPGATVRERFAAVRQRKPAAP
jgi:nucleotide-binding universal stress UspA family protein